MKSLGFSSVAAIAIIAALSIGLLLFSSSDSAQATHAGTSPHETKFQLTTDWFLCNRLPGNFAGTPGSDAGLQGDPSCTTKSAATNSNPDFSYNYRIPSGSTNFAYLAVHLDGDFIVSADGDLADGTAVGGLAAGSTLGLLNSPCNNTVFPEFIFYDSNTDPTDTVATAAEGTTDRFNSLVNDNNNDGIADADSPGVLKWPTFLSNYTDPDRHNEGNNGGIPPISPHARYTGFTTVPPGGDWINLTILVFSPGQLDNGGNGYDDVAGQETNPLTGVANNDLGWTYLTILQDPSAEVASVSSISDFCSPLDVVATFLGDPEGAGVRMTAPASAGTMLVNNQAMGLRDWDGDGLENSLDSCPFTANIENPRNNKGTDDFLGSPVGDMIDEACDPDPTDAEGLGGQDFDSDTFQNAQDNCNQVANVSQTESEGSANTYLAAAPDGGSKSDAIGDACDGVSSGSAPSHNPSGLGDKDLAEGEFLYGWNSGAYCILGTDDDSDGWCDDLDPNDGDSAITAASQQNADTDGYTNQKESGSGLASPLIGLGTDPVTKCGGDKKHDGFPSDMNLDGVVAINDVTGPFAPHFGAIAVDTSPADDIPDNLGTASGDYNNRVDLNQDGAIAINDITGPFAPDFGDTECS